MQKIYAHQMNPAEHPDYGRRHVKPPCRETFDNKVRFTALRGFVQQDGKIVDFKDELDRDTKDFQLGEVIWPSYEVLFAENLPELVEEIKKRKLFLFDIWGYIPGSGPGGYWTQYEIPDGVLDLLESKLDERWLGTDIGEQDGRYAAAFAPQMFPLTGDRVEQYLNAHRHFERMHDDLGNKHVGLSVLNHGHYWLKEGYYTLIGSETAQQHPNGQIYYCFLRGAGKQYGVPWFGNASIFNRWGYKSYGVEKEGEHNSGCGPTKGTSLSLLKRLLYSHILYGCWIAGFENGWYYGSQNLEWGFAKPYKLSPIGRIQQAAKEFVGEHGSFGEMVCPVALLLDFYSSWKFPRYAYSEGWTDPECEAGSHLTNEVFELLYPEYRNSSWFRDESGMISGTPFGDSTDVLLSDVEQWLLKRYSLVVVAGQLQGGLEIRDKLREYIQQGGHVVITAGSLAKLPGGLAGISVNSQLSHFDAGVLGEEYSFDLCGLDLPKEAGVKLRCDGIPAVVEVVCGQGRLTVLASPFGVSAESVDVRDNTEVVDEQLAIPFPMLKHVREVLSEAFGKHRLFDVGDELSLITCRKATGLYTLGICNNRLEQQTLRIVSNCGEIESIEELQIDQSEKSAVGHMPAGFESVDLGESDSDFIAGGDIRIFSVKVSGKEIQQIVHEVPPERVADIGLTLRNVVSIQEEVLRRPTFFEHYDTVVVDWSYLYNREARAIEKESKWIRHQGLKVIVDLSSGINLYPGLRLVNNNKRDYERSVAAIEDVIGKMKLLGAKHLILKLHNVPENNITEEDTRKSIAETLRHLCDKAGDITIHLRATPIDVHRNLTPTTADVVSVIEGVGKSNLKLAVSTAVLIAENQSLNKEYAKHIGLFLLAAPMFSIHNKLWNVHAPVAESGREQKVREIIKSLSNVPVLFDAQYNTYDEEYLDSKSLAAIERDENAIQ